jgi:hypothetical protein
MSVSPLQIDIDKMIDMHSNQAEIDLNAYEDAIDLGDVPIVRVGAGMSTDELLAQEEVMFPKEALALPAKVGLIAQAGFFRPSK